MTITKKVIFAPHDDGSGAFAVLSRLARALLHVANERGYELHLYFLNSSVAVDGQARLDSLLSGLCNEYRHQVILIPTDNLIWLPKDKETAAVIGSLIPDILRKWVRPLWYSWPSTPNWIRPNLPVANREEWIHIGGNNGINYSKEKWDGRKFAQWGVGDLTPQWWHDVAIGISMGVPQLHRIARHESFPSIEIGDWFFSVGLRGCMEESLVSREIIDLTEPELRMIEADEFKASEVWLTLYQAPHQAYMAYVANSPVRFNEMKGLLWTGDPAPSIENWQLAIDLRNAIQDDLSEIRGAQTKYIGYIVPGTTPVWNDIVGKLIRRKIGNSDQVAILDLNRGNSTITLLEDGGRRLNRASNVVASAHSEEMHLAVCRASDFGITRTAGGVLGFAETQRPSILVDEPGHWLGRIQRDQCHEAGLCVVIPITEFLHDPAGVIQMQADKLNTDSELDHIAAVASKLKIGVERNLAEYLFDNYIEARN